MARIGGAMSFSIDDLRAFTLVSRERSVSRAALVLGVAQQSVSERIRRLERRLGVDLFVRLPHGMAPSAAGYRFLPYAERTLALADEALAALQGDDVVRVVVQSSVSVAVMPHLSGTLDGLDMKITEEADAERVLAAVTDGAADVAFGSFPGVDASGGNGHLPQPHEMADRRMGLIVERAFDDPVVCVAPPGHPLAERRGLRFADLAGLSVRTDMGGDLSSSVPNGSPADLRLSPRANVARDIADGSLVELDVIDLPEWVVPVHVAYRDTDRDRPFVSALRAAFANPLPAAPANGARALSRDVA